MKSFSLLFLSLLFAINIVDGQNLITVQNGGEPRFYSKIESAFSEAQNGDTIYLPGGGYSSISISKRVHIIGAGHHPDSAKVTSRTIISNVYLQDGSDYGSLCGIHNGVLTYSDGVVGYSITRCNIWTIGPAQSIGADQSYWLIKECFISGLDLRGSTHLISNNIIYQFARVSNSKIANNIFSNLSSSIASFQGNDNIILNNIFPHTTNPSPGSGNKFYHNVNWGVNGVKNTNQGYGNIITPQYPLDSIFVLFPNVVNGVVQDLYGGDFHLKQNSVLKNTGTDGTDIGIYGGAFPWKEGSVPFNPHFQRVQISPKTDNQGNLNVSIKVSAQDH
jgi:hypothetical protein